MLTELKLHSPSLGDLQTTKNMKLTHNLRAIAASSFTIALLAAGQAAAQGTFTFGGAGANAQMGLPTGVGTANGLGSFASNFFAHGFGPDNSTASDSGLYNTNRFGDPQESFSVNMGNFQAFIPANQVISSVTLFLRKSGGVPLDVSKTFSMYAGLDNDNALAPALGTFTAGPNNGSWGSYGVPLSVLNGFTLSDWDSNTWFQTGVTWATEDNTDPFSTPGFRVTTTLIPEPSTALLSVFGALALLRRRRA